MKPKVGAVGNFHVLFEDRRSGRSGNLFALFVTILQRVYGFSLTISAAASAGTVF